MQRHMFGWFFAWLAVGVLAFANEYCREAWLVDAFGAAGARVISLVMLVAIVHGVAAVYLLLARVDWSADELWSCGALWGLLTLASEATLAMARPAPGAGFSLGTGLALVAVVLVMLTGPPLAGFWLSKVRSGHAGPTR